MGRYTGPSCKQCRRENMKLFLKGDRCFMAKCPVETGRPVPGMHGQRRSKHSDYGVQLREKQRLRRSFGLMERPFRNLFERASREQGVTGERLLQLLEFRLDNLVYRCGFAPSRKAARQFVRHGHVRVKGRRASIPSMILKPGDVFDVAPSETARRHADLFMENAAARGIVSWLRVVPEEYRGEILHEPTREEIAPQIDEQLVVELYSK